MRSNVLRLFLRGITIWEKCESIDVESEVLASTDVFIFVVVEYVDARLACWVCPRNISVFHI